jgi:aminopeptidase N
MESKHAWMDEGVVSYWDEMSLAALYGEEPPRWGETRSYLWLEGDEWEVPIMRHTDLVSPYGHRGLAAYTKPAVMLGALRSVVGEETFAAAFQDFYRSWQWKHPQPWDFFNTVERHHGRDLDWFWRPLFFETDVLDHAVETVERLDGLCRIVLRDRGHAILPTPVRLEMADGSTRRARVSAETWLEGERRYEMVVPEEVVRVELDPEGAFPDVERANNTWEAGR